jgi:hypothetical protein
MNQITPEEEFSWFSIWDNNSNGGGFKRPRVPVTHFGQGKSAAFRISIEAERTGDHIYRRAFGLKRAIALLSCGESRS